MSNLCGKCDLMDSIFGMGGYYDKDGNPVSFNQEGVGCYYSDIFLDFEAFKKATGGVIYKHRNIKIKDWFEEEQFEFIKKHCNIFDYTASINKRADKRCKDGYKKVTNYLLNYYGKDYTPKELNKKGGVYIEVPIKFNTLLDLLPYLPHIVSVMCSLEGKKHVVISNRSFIDEERDKCIGEYAHDHTLFFNYKKQLADLYLKVCERYFLYKKEERTKVISFGERMLKNENGDYNIIINQRIDYMHDIEFVWDDGKNHIHWTSPKLTKDDSGNDHIITVSKEDVERYLKDDIKNNTVKIKYVEYPVNGFPHYLD